MSKLGFQFSEQKDHVLQLPDITSKGLPHWNTTKNTFDTLNLLKIDLLCRSYNTTRL